jgi:hypothetical protein
LDEYFAISLPNFRLFDAKKYFLCIFAVFKIPDRWIYHTAILILGSKFHFWALEAYFCFFDPYKCIFSSSIYNFNFFGLRTFRIKLHRILRIKSLQTCCSTNTKENLLFAHKRIITFRLSIVYRIKPV